MSVLVKICGLTTEAGLDAALACGADMVGFVFFDKSPRHVSLELAASLDRQAAKRACKVLLTVDAGDATLAAAIAALDPGLLQLHGSETPERVASIRARFGLPVMKAIGNCASRRSIGTIPRFDAVADYLLFDAKPLRPMGRPGGNGESFDWSLLGWSKQRNLGCWPAASMQTMWRMRSPRPMRKVSMYLPASKVLQVKKTGVR